MASDSRSTSDRPHVSPAPGSHFTHVFAAALCALVIEAVLGAFPSARVFAADKLVVGKAFPTSFAFIPINVGVEAGIMTKYDLDVTILGFEGAPKLQQGD